MTSILNTKNEKVVKSLFQKYDTIGQNYISRPEFVKLVSDMGYDIDSELLLYVFEIADHDHSDKITFDEFYSWWCGDNKTFFITFYEKNPEWAIYAVDLFKFYDTDKSGDLQHDEFKKMFNDFSKSPFESLKDVWSKNTDLEKVIKQIDKKGTGSIDFDEYFGWLHWNS